MVIFLLDGFSNIPSNTPLRMKMEYFRKVGFPSMRYMVLFWAIGNNLRLLRIARLMKKNLQLYGIDKAENAAEKEPFHFGIWVSKWMLFGRPYSALPFANCNVIEQVEPQNWCSFLRGRMKLALGISVMYLCVCGEMLFFCCNLLLMRAALQIMHNVYSFIFTNTWSLADSITHSKLSS